MRGCPHQPVFVAAAGEGSPARAGIDLHHIVIHPIMRRFPRTRGDRPIIFTIEASNDLVPPHKWAVGTTFEREFDFPVNPNPAYNRPPKPKRKKKQPAKPAAEPAPEPKVSKPASIAAKPKASPKPKRLRLTPEERQERARARAVEARSKLKDAGLCKDCRQPAIPGQTRCPDCAENHRRSRGPR